ncbi:MAG: hypothetical protein GY816_24365 [Cytophagales bacterium]|nr:hypothetical protein [Cytophagales bacterium]
MTFTASCYKKENFYNNDFIQYKGSKFYRGDYVFAFSTEEELVFVNWLDSCHVMILSSLPHFTNEIRECIRRTTDSCGKFEKATFNHPMLVGDYCAKMFHVDRA